MMFPPSLRPNRAGATLMELLIVISIVLALAALLFPMIKSARAKSNETKCVSNLKQMGIAAAMYSSDHNGNWPPNNVSGTDRPGNIFSNYLIPYLGPVPAKGSSSFMKSPLICPTSPVNEPDSNYRFQGVYTPTTYTNPSTGESIAKYGISYAQNVYAAIDTDSRAVLNRKKVELPGQMMLFMEFEGHYVTSLARVVSDAWREAIEARHNKRINVGFADGSVRSVSYGEIPDKVADMPCLFWQGRTK